MKSLPTEADTVKARVLVPTRRNVRALTLPRRTRTQLAAALLTNETDAATKENTLLVLLDLVGPIDVANDLMTLGALVPLIEQLRSSSARVRELAAHVLGAAAANNAGFAAQVTQLGGVEALLARFGADDVEPRTKALYALSALVRAPGPAREAFARAHGVVMLRAVLVTRSEPHKLRKRALTLLTDILATTAADDVAVVLGEDDTALSAAILDRLAGVEPGGQSDNDNAEKALRAMRTLLLARPAIAHAFQAGGAADALQALRLRLEKAVRDSDDDDGVAYVQELAALRDEVEGLRRGAEQGLVTRQRDATEL